MTGKQHDREQLQHASYATASLKWTLTICRARALEEGEGFSFIRPDYKDSRALSHTEKMDQLLSSFLPSSFSL